MRSRQFSLFGLLAFVTLAAAVCGLYRPYLWFMGWLWDNFVRP